MLREIKTYVALTALFYAVQLPAQEVPETKVMRQIEAAHDPAGTFGYQVTETTGEKTSSYVVYCMAGNVLFDHGAQGKRLITGAMSISVFPSSQEIIVAQYKPADPVGSIAVNPSFKGVKGTLDETQDTYVLHYELDSAFSIEAELHVRKPDYRLRQYVLHYRDQSGAVARSVESARLTFTPVDPSEITRDLFTQDYVIITPETINPTPKYKTYDVYNLLF